MPELARVVDAERADEGGARDAGVACAAAAAGGVLYCLGYVGYGVWPCLFVFLTPLWWALEAPGARRRAVTAAAVGVVFGLTAYAGGFFWLWYLVDAFLDGDRVGGACFWLLYGIWFALGFGAYAVTVRALRRRGWPLAVAAIPPLVVLEWRQLQVFPLYAGGGLISVPLLAQSADLGGPLLLTALLGITNVAVFETFAWWRGRRPRPLATWTVALAVALCVLVYGARRITTIEAATRDAPTLEVGLVQANLNPAEKNAYSLLTHTRHLEQTRALLAAGNLDLVIWPETAYVRGLRRPLPVSGRPVRAELAVPLLFGANSVVEKDGHLLKSNSAFLVDADGSIHDGYDKNLLIPFAEYLPLAELLPWTRAWFPHVEQFGAADEVPVLHLGPWRIATPICYEAIHPEFVRRMASAVHPHLLVTLANDAWFGDSQEPWIHLALARLRAIEHRRFLIRATNSGVSAIVDPAGRIVARTGLLTQETLRGVVSPLEGETVYARVGDWPGWLAAAVVVTGLAFGRRRDRNARSA